MLTATKNNKAITKTPLQEGVWEDVWIHSACEMCFSNCGIVVHRVNGVVVKIEGDPECPHNLGKLCAKGQAAIMTLYDPNRVKTPLRRTNPEKGIGIDPKWEAISWEEALDIVCERLKKIRADNPRKVLLQNFDVHTGGKITQPWGSAFGVGSLPSGAAHRCGAGVHAAGYYITGAFFHDVDLNYCNYYISWGYNQGFLTGVNPMPMAIKMAEARARGMKLVVIDPRCSVAAAKADEWIPIRPGTDSAMALAMLNVLLNEQGVYDREFIKKHTNGCYLITPEGFYVRDRETNKPMVWDSVEGKTKTFDAAVKDYAIEAIEGSYLVDGVECRPAFQLLKEHVKEYTPEKVAPITTVPAATIRRIAQEFGEAAKIGATIVVKGKELPYRPAAINYYKGIVARTQSIWQQLSLLLLNLVVGSFYSPGSFGGTNLVGPSGSWHPGESADGLMLPITSIHPEDVYDLSHRKATREQGVGPALTRGMGQGRLGFYALAEPEKYQVEVKPEMMLICRTNWLMSQENLKLVTKAILNIPFIVFFGTMLDETAEFADIVLPDTVSLERSGLFPNSRMMAHIAPVTDYFYYGVRQPVVKPAYEARQWLEVLLEIADRVGFRKEMNRELNRFPNTEISISNPAYQLDPEKKYSLDEIHDRMAKSQFGPEHGIQWFNEHGYLKVKRNAEERYPIADLKPRVPIYYENFLRGRDEVQAAMKEHNITWWDTIDFVALPYWRPSPAHQRRQSTEYDLFCIPYHDSLTSKTISAENAWLNEVAERHFRLLKIEMNTEAAKKRGIKDGDLIWVESIAGKVKGRVRVTECIHPETVAIAGTLGGWARGKPIARGKGVHHNSLVPVSDDRIDHITGAIDDCVEVKVYKAEKER